MTKKDWLVRLLCLILLAMDLFLFWSFRAFGGIVFAMPVVLGLPIALWQSPRPLRLVKLLITPYILLFLVIPKPWFWPSQILRRLDKRLVISPEDPYIARLHREFLDVVEREVISPTGKEEESATWKTASESDQIRRVNEFVGQRVPYCYDFDNWGIFAHMANPKEVLETKGKDDCQGRAFVTLSLLKRMGYQAYCAETPFHVYTVVLSRETQTWHFLNRGRAPDPLMLFDDRVSLFPWSRKPAPIRMSGYLGELFSPYDNHVIFIPFRNAMKSTGRWILLLLGLFPLSCLGAMFLCAPERFPQPMGRFLACSLWIWAWLGLTVLATAGLAGSEKTLWGCMSVLLLCLWSGAAGCDRFLSRPKIFPAIDSPGR